MTIGIAQVASEDDLIAELGGSADVLENLTSDTFTAAEALALSLTDVVYELRNREPPVLESDIAAPTELKRAVVERTISRLYCNGITTPDGVNATKYKIYQKRYESTIESLRPTVGFGLATAAPFGITMHRR